jgi:hypothetical protein
MPVCTYGVVAYSSEQKIMVSFSLAKRAMTIIRLESFEDLFQCVYIEIPSILCKIYYRL